MKLRTAMLSSAAAVALCAAAAPQAQAQSAFDGFYVGGAAGYHRFEAENPSNTFTACCSAKHTDGPWGNKHGDGGIVDLFGGYGMTFGGQFYVGGEFDASFSGASTGSFLSPEGSHAFGVPAIAKFSAEDGYGLSARFGYLFNPTVLGYLRVGGRAQRFRATSTGGDRAQINGQSSFVGGVRAGAGVEFALANLTGVGALLLRAEYDHDEYSRFNVGAGPAPFFKFSGCCGFQTVHFNPHDDVATLGLVLKFGAPPPPPPPVAAAPPAPMPAAAPPPQTQTFVVYFDFNKSDLTAAGARVVQQAADYFKAHGSVRVKVDGYTDLAGTQTYNLGLSQRRADTVRGGLVKDGVPANVITAAWHGKENPAVPTPDGVREARNRRAEIVE